jgi:hypothetical protein
MKPTTKTVASIGALIGATLVIAVPTTASAASPTRWDVCPAVVDEPRCDLVEHVPTSTNGSATEPAVVPEDDPTSDASTDALFGCVRIGHVHACAA